MVNSSHTEAQTMWQGLHYPLTQTKHAMRAVLKRTGDIRPTAAVTFLMVGPSTTTEERFRDITPMHPEAIQQLWNVLAR